MKNNNYFKIVLTSIVLSEFVIGCSKVIDAPYIGYTENADIWNTSKYAQGVLNEVYNYLYIDRMNLYGINDDYNTDNAVRNNQVTSYATGGANASNYPLGRWDFQYLNILHINQYLAYGLNIPYDNTDIIPGKPIPARLYLYGEAYFLRAWAESELLKQFAGPVAGNKTEIMGIPLLRKIYDKSEIVNVPRSTYDICIKNILSDLDSTLKYCPFEYNQASGVNATQFRGRATQRTALALKSRVLLHAASPAFNLQSDLEKWKSAANAAYAAIMMDGGLINLGTLADENNDANVDVIWKTNTITRSNDIEDLHFPPSYYGAGQCNPSQNLVDAFPMANGTPINEAGSNYNPTDPYSGRDDRFEKFIVHNADPLYGFKTIQTYIGGADAKGGLRNDATRTGYYMQRFTADVAATADPRVNAGKSIGAMAFVRLLDREEVYLNFVEAANEAISSPTSLLPGTTFSAYDVFKKIRIRGGVNALQYTELLRNSGQLTQSKFRQIIKDERRIEMCFRGFRYWDLRRWLEPINVINVPVKGIVIQRSVSNGVDSYTYNQEVVESRGYQSNTYYGPLPYTEVVKSKVLNQNYGW